LQISKFTNSTVQFENSTARFVNWQFMQHNLQQIVLHSLPIHKLHNTNLKLYCAICSSQIVQH